MYSNLWNILGVVSIALSGYTFADPNFNQDAIPNPYADYTSFSRGFNPGAVFPSAIVQQPASLQVSSFNPPQELRASSVLPNSFRSNPTTGVIDNNPHPAALAQQKTFPQVSSFNPSQELKASSVFPKGFNQVNRVIDSNPSAAASFQPQNFPRLSSFNASPDEETSPDLLQKSKTPFNQSCGSGKSHFSEAVRAFASNFVQRIQSSPKYTDAFSLQHSNRETAVQTFHGYIYNLNKRKGDVDPEFSAYTASQALKKNYEPTKTEGFIEAHGYFVGELLHQTRHLTTENALKLSNEYFQVTADSIDSLKDNTPKLLGVVAGVENFLSSYDIYAPELAFTVPAVFYQVYFTLNENCS